MKYRAREGVIRPDMIHLLMLARKGNLKHDDETSKTDNTGFATIQQTSLNESESKNGKSSKLYKNLSVKE